MFSGSIAEPAKPLTLDNFYVAVRMTNKSGTAWANTVQLRLSHMPAAFPSASTSLTVSALLEGLWLAPIQHAGRSQGESAQSLD